MILRYAFGLCIEIRIFLVTQYHNYKLTRCSTPKKQFVYFQHLDQEATKFADYNKTDLYHMKSILPGKKLFRYIVRKYYSSHRFHIKRIHLWPLIRKHSKRIYKEYHQLLKNTRKKFLLVWSYGMRKRRSGMLALLNITSILLHLFCLI